MAQQEYQRPINIDPFFDQARLKILDLLPKIPLVSAILDDWNTGEGIKGARIIYGISCTLGCSSKCTDCLLFQAVGEDLPNVKLDFRSSLCLATEAQLKLFSSKQRYLNCKTLQEYQDAFIIYMVKVCTSPELIKIELDWVKGFRILFLDGKDDIDFLKEKEREVKSYIMEETIKKLSKASDFRRRQIVEEYKRQFET